MVVGLNSRIFEILHFEGKFAGFLCSCFGWDLVSQKKEKEKRKGKIDAVCCRVVNIGVFFLSFVGE